MGRPPNETGRVGANEELPESEKIGPDGLSLRQRIRHLREERGYTFDKMVALTGLSRGTLWEAETTYGRNPYFATLCAIADGLEVPVEYVRTGAMPMDTLDLSVIPYEAFLQAKGIREPRNLRTITELAELLKSYEVEDQASAEGGEREPEA